MGYRWSNGLRLEAEYGYRRNSVEKVKFHGVTHHPRDIHFQSSSVMVNALWNMDLCQWGCDFYNITPIIGVGIGYDWERFTIRHGDFHKSHKKDGFAWQVIAGLSYPIYCNTDLSIEYRVHQGRLRDLYNHTIGLGLNYQFDLSCF